MKNILDNKFDQLYDKADQMIVAINAQTKEVVNCNKKAVDVLGYSKEEILGKIIFSFYKEESLDTAKKDLQNFIEQGQISGHELVLKAKDGRDVDIITCYSGFFDHKKMHYCLVTWRDMSRIKEEQEQIMKVFNDLQESSQKISEEKARIESLLGSIGDGIIATDQDGNITLINKAAELMLGWKSKDAQGKPVVDIVKLVDKDKKGIPLYKRPMVLALSTGKKTTIPAGETYYFSRKEGESFPVGVTVTPYVSAGRIVGTIMVFRDITIEKNIDQAKNEFVSLASHQLRTPLSAINWFAEMLLAGDMGEVPDSQKEYIQDIYDSNKRMTELVNSLLNVSRIDLGTFVIQPELMDITEVAEPVIKELKPKIDQKELEFEKVYDPKLSKMMVDPKLLRIVFQNLLSNAVKYTPEKGKVILKIEKRLEDILITVKDNGYGIPLSQQRQIFSKLFRADNVKAVGVEGTGLGLYLVKSIIDHSKGQVWFESEENKGTTFFVTIPLEGMLKKSGTKMLSESKV